VSGGRVLDSFEDGKRKRCAEVLVPGTIDLRSIDRIVVSNKAAAARVRRALASTRNIRVLVHEDYFF